MKMTWKFSWARLTKVRTWHRRSLLSMLLVLSVGHIGSVHAVDPPENIRSDNGVLLWDAVENALNYNVYFLTGAVVDNTVTPRYVTTVGDIREFRPIVDGFYTVVANVQGDDGLEFSNVAESGTVSFSGTSEVALEDIFQLRSARCNNVVAGGSCAVGCPFLEKQIPTGGACRADAGVVLHQRARQESFACITQNDTSFMEVDVYCLDTTRF